MRPDSCSILPHIFCRAEQLAQFGIRAAVIYHLCCFLGYVVRTCLYHKAARTTASEALPVIPCL
jgi:hypothetical protein